MLSPSLLLPLTPDFPPQTLSLSAFTPSRLLQDPQVNLRTTDKGFVEAVDKYFDHLISRVVHLQVRPNDLFPLSYICFRKIVCTDLFME